MKHIQTILTDCKRVETDYIPLIESFYLVRIKMED